MSNIVDRLRRLYVQHGTDYVQEAADEIERLRAERDALQIDAQRWRTFLSTRPENTHEVICRAIDDARKA